MQKSQNNLFSRKSILKKLSHITFVFCLVVISCYFIYPIAKAFSTDEQENVISKKTQLQKEHDQKIAEAKKAAEAKRQAVQAKKEALQKENENNTQLHCCRVGMRIYLHIHYAVRTAI